MSAAFVVVDPASMPRNTGPEASEIFPLFILSLACLSLNSLSSSSSRKSGLMYFVSVISSGDALSSLSIRESSSAASDFSARYAAPMATKNFAFSGNMTFSSFRERVSMNLFLSSERYSRGPPRNATLPLIGCPQARPDIIWFTTAWNIDAAISAVLAPSLISGCMSVFANTPQREAIG